MAWVIIVFHVVGFLSAIDAVMSTRTAQGTVAWIIVAKIPYLRRNEVELLVDGETTFGSIFAGIASAEKYVLVQFFIVHDDELGRALKSALLERARAGVRVYFLYDEIGSHDLPKRYLEELREAGVEAFDFHTQKGYLFASSSLIRPIISWSTWPRSHTTRRRRERVSGSSDTGMVFSTKRSY